MAPPFKKGGRKLLNKISQDYRLKGQKNGKQRKSRL
jgi:hypothetical protein